MLRCDVMSVILYDCFYLRILHCCASLSFNPQPLLSFFLSLTTFFTELVLASRGKVEKHDKQRIN